MSYGLVFDERKPEDYVLGGLTSLDIPVLVPDGQWDEYIPADELQAQYVETSACASFGTLNCVEALERREFGVATNWSDRFLAEVSGTTPQGNSPHTVAESLRKKKCVYEAEWPYTPDLDTWGKFYQTPPYNLIVRAQIEFGYDFGHQWINTDQASMMEALKYSPIGADVQAWGIPENGIYHRLGQSNHWICIYGYVPNQYWKVFDSYDNTHKKVAWDFGFTMVKGYTLHKQVLTESIFDKAIRWLRAHWFTDRTFGVARDPKFAKLSKDMIAEVGGLCQMGKHKPTLLNPLNSHHVLPFHTNKSEELNPKNLIVLCRFHHFAHGHFFSWRDSNPRIKEEAVAFNKTLQAHRNIK